MRGTHLTIEFRPPVPQPGRRRPGSPARRRSPTSWRPTAPHLLPGRVPEDDRAGTPRPGGAPGLDVPHGTTIVALTFAGGVVIAGDRRATMGNMIAQRDIEKVFITDSYSAVGIAGSAGIAVEMVRLFTVELEHYEKIEGVPLSLDGKANQLASDGPRATSARRCRASSSSRCSSGYDTDAADPADGRAGSSPTTSPAAATRSSGLPRRRLRVGVRPVGAQEAARARRRPGHRGPHCRRGALRRRRRRHRHRRPGPHPRHLPGGRQRSPATARCAVRTTTSARSPRPWCRSRQRPAADAPCPRRTPPLRTLEPPRDDAVLLLRRPAPARPLGAGPQGHRPRPQRRGAHLRRRCAVRRGEPLADAAQGLGDLRPDRVRRRRPVQRVRDAAHRGHPARRRPRLLLRPARRHRPLAGQRLRPDPRVHLHRAAEAVRGRAVRRRGRRRTAGGRPALPDHLRRLDHRRAAVRRDGRAAPTRSAPASGLLPGRRRAGRRPRGGRQGPAVGTGARPRRQRPRRGPRCSG